MRSKKLGVTGADVNNQTTPSQAVEGDTGIRSRLSRSKVALAGCGVAVLSVGVFFVTSSGSGSAPLTATVADAAVPGTTTKTVSKAPVTSVAKNATSTSTSNASTKVSSKTSKSKSPSTSSKPAPTVVVTAKTPAPTTTTAANGAGFKGSEFPNGATVGTDIPAGRYWATNCWSWSVHSDNGTIAQSSYSFTQSVIDVRSGEFVLTSTKCQWNAGNPPAASTLPTGKVVVGTQLTPGRWRAANLDGCVTGPSSTRDRAAITDPSKMIVWWPGTADLVVTGNENWSAYLVGLECGGLVKVG